MKPIEYFKKLDEDDPLSGAREEFHIPKSAAGKEKIYFCGNSLGLQPKASVQSLQVEIEKWKKLGVDGHFEGEYPWMPYHKFLSRDLAALVGGKTTEVVAMNSLTANLHFMMASFYRPTRERFKILIEKGAFPSDHFAAESQLKFHGFDPSEGLVTVSPDTHADILSTETILDLVESNRDSLALVLLPGVQYYTGQVLDMKAITDVARRYDIPVGFDLAHAAGNIPLDLHDWGVDFGVWCHYKYLNSGPGAVGGCFVHERHHDNPHLPKLTGWWGQNESTRFKMETEFDPTPTAESWQLSNPPIASLSLIRGSVGLFQKYGGVKALFKKTSKLFDLLVQSIEENFPEDVEIITPKGKGMHGSQLSLKMHPSFDGKKIFDYLTSNDIVCDWRHPSVIRLAPVPLYNTFCDIYQFVNTLGEAIHEQK